MKSALLIAALTFVSAGTAAARAEDAAKPDELFKKLDVNGDGKLTASEIPKEQEKAFERLLRLGDADKNGELTHEEFERAMLHKESPVTDISRTGGLGGAPGGRPNVDPKRIFEMLDKNKDGKITRDEVGDRPRISQLMDRLGKDELTVDDLSAMGGKGGKREAKGKKGKTPAATTPKVATPTGATPKTAAPKTDSEKEEMPAPAQAGRLRARRLAAAGGAAAGGKGRKQIAEMLKNADKDGDGKISMEEAPPRLKEHFAQIDKNNDGFLDKTELEQAMRQMQPQRKKAGKKGAQKPAATTPAEEKPST